jgi:uncharacterized membrane protein YfcA
MQVYLPIAGLSVDVFTILALGGVTGVLSGMFGIGGGFLATPLLIFIGVPPPVAVATSGNQIIAASASGFMTHWRRGNVDFQVGALLLLGGLAGSSVGVWLFALLKRAGQIDLVISLCYVLFLSAIGYMMGMESLRAIRNQAKPRKKSSDKDMATRWFSFLPFKVTFTHAQREISVILPLVIGLLVGVLVSLMGIGGGFFLVPAMIYLLGVPASMVVGTSLFQVTFVTVNVTLLQAIHTQTVDMLLALLLLASASVGAQMGIRLSARMKTEYLRGLLALLVLGVALRLGVGLLLRPSELYSVALEGMQ